MTRYSSGSALRRVAEFMCLAAQTAPKAKGINNLATEIVSQQNDLRSLAADMCRIGTRENKPGFIRDAENVRAAAAVVLIGTRLAPVGLAYCSLCGAANCEMLTQRSGRCAFNSLDLGIAVGSAVSKAADFRADNRIMYSVGKVAVECGYFRSADIGIAVGIPLSASGKNLFFDRS